MGFRLKGSTKVNELIYKCFHLFQRVVGFRQFIKSEIERQWIDKFPSLSESSGFPTGTDEELWDTDNELVSISFRE